MVAYINILLIANFLTIIIASHYQLSYLSVFVIFYGNQNISLFNLAVLLHDLFCNKNVYDNYSSVINFE